MIKIIYLLAIIGLGQGLQHGAPTRAEVESSINRTIEEVERMVRSDPSLPQLTRKEIVNILYNITSKDVNTFKNKGGIDVARTMYQKALMVVLPYNAKDSSESLKDLYTKPPMIQMIPDSSMNGDNAPFPEEGVQVYTQNSKNIEEDNIVATYTSVETTSKDNETSKHRYKNHRETYSDVQTRPSILEKLKSDSAPMKFSFNLENLQKDSYNLHKTDTITRRPVYYRVTTEKDKSTTASTLEIVYSTPPDEEVKRKGSEGIIIDLKPSVPSPPTMKASSNVLTSDQWRYYAPPTTTEKLVTSAIAPEKSLEENMDDKTIVTTIRVVVGDVVTETGKQNETPDKSSMKLNEENIGDSTFSPVTDKIMPEGHAIPTMKTKVSEITTQESTKEKDNVFMFVTPTASSTSEDVSENSMYTTNSADIRLSTAKTVTPMSKEIEELLASIGLRSDSKINIEDIYKKNKEIFESKFRIPDTNSVLYTPTSGLTSVAADTPSISNQNTFENPVSDFRKGVDNLSPDVQLLFQRFGLQTSQQREALEASTTTTNRPRLTINFNSYTNFKPIPTSKVKDQEMKDFLAQFGLGINDNRNQKAMKTPTERPSLIEAVPSNMKKILENIGLITKSKNNPEPEKIPLATIATTKFHVFKPHEAIVKDEKQRMKINELLDMVKMVQQGTADVKDVQKIAAELQSSAKTLKDGPDPLNLEDILNLYSQDLKNEVKREQDDASEEKQEQKRQTTTDDEEEKPSLISTATTESMDGTTQTTSSPSSQASTTVSPESRDSSTASSKAPSSTTFSWDFVDTLTSTTMATPTATAEPSNLDALADSFGGSTQTPDPVLPTKRRNGFYFLVDWNTFLEVGEEGKDKVNLRFQPKVGDPNRFISVRVP